jgi:hypothetical protein
MALLKLLDRMGRRNAITTHGFRSTFRDWVAEQTSHPRDVVEMALSANGAKRTLAERPLLTQSAPVFRALFHFN